MKRFLFLPLAGAIVFVTGILNVAFGEAIVTLKSGEILHGEITSDTSDVLQIRAFNASRTISSLRNLPRSDIQNIHIETPAEAAEQIDYFALSKFQLDPDQEQSSNFYTQWIAAFEKFLRDHPQSDKATIVQQHIEVCQSDLKHLAAGEVRFRDKWMTPEEKKPLLLMKALAELQSQRDAIAKDITKLQGQIQEAEARLARFPHSSLPYTQQPSYGTVRAIEDFHQQLSLDQINLANFDKNIQSLRVEIEQAQQAHGSALSKTKPEDNQAPTSSPTLQPSTPTSLPIAGTPSWIEKNWKGLAIGIGILGLLLLALAYPFKRLRQKMGQAQAQRDTQRRVASANLKKLFDRIFAEGERPQGPNVPEGRIIPIGKGEDSYGGGRWFVIGDVHIWAVQNNGRDEDNWLYNNVTTKGRGAVGARIPVDPEWANAIDAEANAAK